MYKVITHKSLFTLIILSLVLLFTACENDSVNDPSGEIDFSSSEYAILDIEDAMNTIQGGTIEQGFQISSPVPGENGFVRGPGGERPGRHLRSILWLLELNDEQRESIRSYAIESHTCMSESFIDFRTAIQPILENANLERTAIITQYRNGEITNQEAYLALQELRENTHNTIENDPEVQGAKQAMCDCKINLLDNIGSILTEDQLAIWNDWYSNLNGPCFD